MSCTNDHTFPLFHLSTLTQLPILNTLSLHFTLLHFTSLLTLLPFPSLLLIAFLFWFPPHSHFASFIIFLTLFINYFVYTRASQKHLQVDGSRAVWSYFQRSIFRYLSAAFYSWVSCHDRPCSDSMAFSTIAYSLPSPFPLVCFEESAYASYLSALCQAFPGRIVCVVCKFSRFILHPV
jgi:hypothetical protein